MTLVEGRFGLIEKPGRTTLSTHPIGLKDIGHKHCWVHLKASALLPCSSKQSPRGTMLLLLNKYGLWRCSSQYSNFHSNPPSKYVSPFGIPRIFFQFQSGHSQWFSLPPSDPWNGGGLQSSLIFPRQPFWTSARIAEIASFYLSKP